MRSTCWSRRPGAAPGLHFEPVFDYEQVLVVARGHALAGAPARCRGSWRRRC